MNIQTMLECSRIYSLRYIEEPFINDRVRDGVVEVRNSGSAHGGGYAKFGQCRWWMVRTPNSGSADGGGYDAQFRQCCQHLFPNPSTQFWNLQNANLQPPIAWDLLGFSP